MTEDNTTTRPPHYGGEENPFEPIRIIEHYGLGFHLGNTLKYILRADKKGSKIEDLEKALWYLSRFVEQVKGTKPRSVRLRMGITVPKNQILKGHTESSLNLETDQSVETIGAEMPDDKFASGVKQRVTYLHPKDGWMEFYVDRDLINDPWDSVKAGDRVMFIVDHKIDSTTIFKGTEVIVSHYEQHAPVRQVSFWWNGNMLWAPTRVLRRIASIFVPRSCDPLEP